MSFRSSRSRNTGALQPEYVRPTVGGAFRFAIPVLRVRDVTATVAWYRRHLGFAAEAFPERAPHEFAIIERDGVQVLVRQSREDAPARDGHAGWDLYLWVDGLDLRRLEASFAISGGEIVRPLSPMSASIAELEIRDRMDTCCASAAGRPPHRSPKRDQELSMINNTEAGPLFTLEDVLRLQRLAASFEFRARTTRHLEEAQDAERVANHLHVLADKVAQHVVS